MSGLDPIGRRMIFDLVVELKNSGKTVFFCSHILNDVERLCDRIGVLARSRLIRLLDRSDFSGDENRTVHLSLPVLGDEQSRFLERHPCSLRYRKEGAILSTGPEELPTILASLQQLEIPVLGSRSEGFSLEDLFLDSVEEIKV